VVHRLVVLALARLTRSRDDEQGAVLIIVTIVMVTLLGVAALVIDIGNASQQSRQAQAAADSGALAATQRIEDYGGTFTGSSTQWQGVVNDVKLYVQSNFGISSASWQGCTDAHALTFRPDTGAANACISADMAAWPATLAGETSRTNRIRVRLPDKLVATGFGKVLDVDSLSVGAVATAAVTRATTRVTTREVEHQAGGTCALCVLSPTGTSLDGQNGDITVTGGDVVVNSLASTAATLNPNGRIRAIPTEHIPHPAIGGPGCEPGSCNFSGDGYSPNPSHLPEATDPLINMPQCESEPSCASLTPKSGSGANLSPGIYNTISGSHTLSPGIYVIKSGITLNGNDLLTGNGVMLYFACSSYPTPCSPGQAGAGIKATGNGAMRIFPPTEGVYQGLSLFADRNNTATLTYRGNGTNENGLTNGGAGTFYMKSGTLDLRGNGYTLASEIIVGFMTMEGNPSGVAIVYDQARNVPLTHDVEHESTTQATSYDAGGLVG
jgi:hypothetical protein